MIRKRELFEAITPVIVSVYMRDRIDGGEASREVSKKCSNKNPMDSAFCHICQLLYIDDYIYW